MTDSWVRLCFHKEEEEEEEEQQQQQPKSTSTFSRKLKFGM